MGTPVDLSGISGINQTCSRMPVPVSLPKNPPVTQSIGYPIEKPKETWNLGNSGKWGTGVETISGINWYYYLVPKDGKQSLIGSVGEDQICRKFVVCANLPDGINYKTGKTKIMRLFAAFSSHLDFLRYAKQIPVENWYFFEVILGNQAQKLYFDIDVHPEEVEGNVDSFVQRLLTNLISRIVDTFRNRNIELDLAKNVLIFSSNSKDSTSGDSTSGDSTSGDSNYKDSNSKDPNNVVTDTEEKRSYHIIIDGHSVGNYRENGLLAGEVLDGFPEDYLKFIDQSMYSSKQQLRLYKSRKAGSNRIKIFVEEWPHGINMVKYNYPDIDAPDNEAKQNAQFASLFGASCVTIIDGCQIIPGIMADLEEIGEAGFRPHNFDDTEISNDALVAITERAQSVIFQIYSVTNIMGPFIILKRKVSAHCSLCQRAHDSENAFLRVNPKGNVYFHCRRNQNSSRFVASIADLIDVADEVKEVQDLHLKSVMSKLSQMNIKLEPQESINQGSQSPTIQGSVSPIVQGSVSQGSPIQGSPIQGSPIQGSPTRYIGQNSQPPANQPFNHKLSPGVLSQFTLAQQPKNQPENNSADVEQPIKSMIATPNPINITGSVHSKLREISSQPNIVFKPRKRNWN